MSTWREARARLAEILGAVTITVPHDEHVRFVHQTPPKAIQDLPCFVFYPPAMTVDRASCLRTRVYTLRARLFVLDADLPVAADLADALREAVIDAVDKDLTLEGKASLVHGPECPEAGSHTYNDSVTYTVQDFIFEIHLIGAGQFEA